ncbi:MAG: methyltransferase domain-containing protein [Methanocorpusculum sp.]|nr:methyltransferase domain-containing protein [Methanocorpusculum sp.]
MTANLPGGPTAPEVMAVSLEKLHLKPGFCAADLGCGTGSVTKKIAEAVGQAGYTYAVDARPEAVACTNETCRGLSVEVLHTDIVSFLQSGHKKIDCAFVGGSRDLPEVLALLKNQGAQNIVVNAVLLDTAYQAIRTMKELGIFREAVHMQVSKSYELTGKTMFKPINPIYIICGGTAC